MDKVLTKGDKAPDFTLQNTVGNSINLYETLLSGPVVAGSTEESGDRSATWSWKLFRRPGRNSHLWEPPF